MSKLKIEFHGICVHFMDIVPGVSHRVVLPNAIGVQFGKVHVMDSEPVTSPAPYYLLPHYAYLKTTAEADPTILEGVHLRILNAKRQPRHYPEKIFEPYRLSHYVPRTIGYSNEVVLGGRAAAYFDFHGGDWATPTTERGARYTTVELETHGPAKIAITPFPGSLATARTEIVKVDEGWISVGNIDVDSVDEDVEFDFLLNYLVTQEGIPEVLTRAVPGMPGGVPPSMMTTRAAGAMRRLAERIGRPASGGTPGTEHRKISWVPENLHPVEDVATASCSNSAWP